MTDPTMTLHELAEALRANGVRATEDRLRDMILTGQFPFAFGVTGQGGEKGGEKSRATILIFRSRFYLWLDEMLSKEAVRI